MVRCAAGERRWTVSDEYPSDAELTAEAKKQAAEGGAVAGNAGGFAGDDDRPVELKVISGADAVKLPAPKRVLWLAAGAEPAVVSVGEPAILAAPGGSGKSYAVLSLMLAAASGSGSALGFGVRPGRAVYVSYEDEPGRIGARLNALRATAGLKDLSIIPWAAALFKPEIDGGGGARDTKTLTALVALLARERPSFVVVDPAAAAAGACGLNDPTAARAMMRTFAAVSAFTGAGFLILAHDTKQARTEARLGQSPGAGAVSGSAQWHDAARAVLYLHRVDGGREVESLKANHGVSGWAQPLEEVKDDDGTFRGFKVNGAPWWDYEAIRRERLAQAAAEADTEKQRAREAAKRSKQSKPATAPAANGAAWDGPVA